MIKDDMYLSKLKLMIKVFLIGSFVIYLNEDSVTIVCEKKFIIISVACSEKIVLLKNTVKTNFAEKSKSLNDFMF